MGSGPALFMANSFLYYYENKWLLDTKKTYTISFQTSENILTYKKIFR